MALCAAGSCEDTDENGWVWWMGLGAGDYEVWEEERGGWFNTTDNNPAFIRVLRDSFMSEDVWFGNMRIARPTRSGGGGGGLITMLTVTKDVDFDEVLPTTEILYTITLSSTGTATVQNIVVTDVLPPGFEASEPTTRTWTIDQLDLDETETIEYRVTVMEDAAEGVYTNTVTVTSTNYILITASRDVKVLSTGAVLSEEALPKLSIIVTVDPLFANPGETVTYTITVTNNGDAVATEVVVNVELPEGFSEGTNQISGLMRTVFAALIRAAHAAGVVSYNVGDLEPGASWTTTLQVLVGSDVAPGVYSSTASAFGSNHSLVVGPKADLEVREGEVLGFTTLPETGGAQGALVTYGFITLILLLLYGFGIRRLVHVTVRSSRRT